MRTRDPNNSNTVKLDLIITSIQISSSKCLKAMINNSSNLKEEVMINNISKILKDMVQLQVEPVQVMMLVQGMELVLELVLEPVMVMAPATEWVNRGHLKRRPTRNIHPR